MIKRISKSLLLILIVTIVWGVTIREVGNTSQPLVSATKTIGVFATNLFYWFSILFVYDQIFDDFLEQSFVRIRFKSLGQLCFVIGLKILIFTVVSISFLFVVTLILLGKYCLPTALLFITLFMIIMLVMDELWHFYQLNQKSLLIIIFVLLVLF
ncbi:hypothetical protein PT281_03790 [Lactobacillus sp. ESL0701]|uniref:hypothetical protein n=1 Tax=Lactobacillus sp. ESL0701 TaxID=2983217 RepID=UPI0023F656E5|nr:hypothetical protein [Lactobacillus sp. ESL0701]MDF7672385.1 hypothetical protein [Lactobacillus sp. ESL0701]